MRLLPRIIDERLIAAEVGLPHGEPLTAEPFLVALAEHRVAIPIGVLLEVLEVQELQRDAGPSELDMYVRQVRLRSALALASARSVHPSLELFVVELLDRFPVEAQQLCARRCARHAARTNTNGSCRFSMAASEQQLLAQNLA